MRLLYCFLWESCSFPTCERILTEAGQLAFNLSLWAGAYMVATLSKTHGNFMRFNLIYLTHEIYRAGLSRQD